MPSANGYLLEVNGYTLKAYWPAPYYSLHLDDSDDPGEPLLIHCDDLAHARRHGGIILNAKFERVP